MELIFWLIVNLIKAISGNSAPKPVAPPPPPQYVPPPQAPYAPPPLGNPQPGRNSRNPGASYSTVPDSRRTLSKGQPSPQQRQSMKKQPPKIRQLPAMQRARQQGRVPVRQGPPVPPPLPRPPEPVFQQSVITTSSGARSTASAAAPPAKRGAAFADAATLRRWLKPGTLRSQFILTEVFQPPIALRPPRD